MTNENNILENVLNYIRRDKVEYALLLTGEWGVGKTYFWKSVLEPKIKKSLEDQKKMNNTGDYPDPRYISLYGIRDEQMLHDAIIRSFSPLHGNSSIFGSEIKTDQYIQNSLFNLMLNTRNPITDLKANNAGMKRNHKKKDIDFYKAVLCLDDIERRHMPLEILLGYINKLITEENIKVILLANEKKILEENSRLESKQESGALSIDYEILKEKVIGQTIFFHQSPEQITTALIDDMELYSPIREAENIPQELKDEFIKMLYQDLTKQKEWINNLLTSAQIHNYRIVKQILDDLVSLYKSAGYDKLVNLYPRNRSKIIHSLFQFSLAKKAGDLKIKDLEEIKDKESFMIELQKSSIENNASGLVNNLRSFADKYNFLPMDIHIPVFSMVIYLIRDGLIDTRLIDKDVNQLLKDQKSEENSITRIENYESLSDEDLIQTIDSVIEAIKKQNVSVQKYMNLFTLIREMINFKVYERISSEEKLYEIFSESLNKKTEDPNSLSEGLVMIAQRIANQNSNKYDQKLFEDLCKYRDQRKADAKKEELQTWMTKIQEEKDPDFIIEFLRNYGKDENNITKTIKPKVFINALICLPTESISQVFSTIRQRFAEHEHDDQEIYWWEKTFKILGRILRTPQMLEETEKLSKVHLFTLFIAYRTTFSVFGELKKHLESQQESVDE